MLPAGILSVPSSELQSYRAWAPGLQPVDTFSFNFADLLPNHVPILAYEGQSRCFLQYIDILGGNLCNTIFESSYAPQLVYPTQFKELDPQISSCVFDWNGLYDPPTSLVPVGWLTAPTTSAGGGDPIITSEPAAPRPNGHLVELPPTTVSFSRVSAVTDAPGDPGPSTNYAAALESNAVPGPGSDDSTAVGGSDPPTAPPQATGAIIPLGPGTTITASVINYATVVVAGQTLRASGSAATLPGGAIISAAAEGTIVVLQRGGNGASASSIAPSAIAAAPSAVFGVGGELVVDGVTKTLPLTVPGAAPPVALVTLPDGGALTATSAAGVVLLLGEALSVGGAALTTAGVVLSAAFGGVVVYADPSGNGLVEGAVFTAGTVASTVYESVDAKGSTFVVIGSQTLTVGGSPVTLPDGQVVSAGASGLLVVGEGKTSSLGFSAIPAATAMVTTSTADGDGLEETETLTNVIPDSSITGTAAPQASSTHKKNGGHKIRLGWQSVVIGVSLYTLAAL